MDVCPVCRLRNRYGASVCAECGAPLSNAARSAAPPIQDAKGALSGMIAQLASASNRVDHLRELAILAYKTGELGIAFPVIAREVMQSPWDPELIQLAIDSDVLAVDQNWTLIAEKQAKTAKPKGKHDLARIRHFMDDILLAEWSGLPGVRHLIEPEKIEAETDEFYKEQLNSFLRVGSNQMPGLKALLDTVVERLGVASVELLVDPTLEIGAYTYGLSRCVVVLSRGLLDSMTDEEIVFVIGHELGHHVLGSTRYSRAANWVSNGYYSTLGDRKAQQHLYFILGGNQAFESMRVDPDLFDLRVKRGSELTNSVLRWRPICEFSCDRIGAIAVQDADTAVRALFKLVVGAGKELESRFGAVHDVEAFLAQHDESLALATEEAKKFDAVRSHPFLAVRMRALRCFGLAMPAYL